MKKTWFLMTSIVLMFVLAACGNSDASESGLGDSAIAYNNPPQWANFASVQEGFLEESGIDVPSDNKNSGETITALIAEKDDPIADVAYYGIVFGPQAIENDLVQGYKPEYFDDIPDELKDPDGKWMTVHYGTVAFLVNTDALGDTPVPQSWEDLLKPEYKGKVGFLDPTAAAIGYSVTTAANLAMGGDLQNWEPGIEYFQKLMENDLILPKQTATAKVVKGEIPILIDADFNGYPAKYDENAPIDIVIPEEGSLKVPYIVSLVKDAPHEAEGQTYIDFMLSDKGQTLFAEGFVRPIREDVDIPEELENKFLPASDYERAADVNYEEMNEVQDTFIEQWKNEVAN